MQSNSGSVRTQNAVGVVVGVRGVRSVGRFGRVAQMDDGKNTFRFSLRELQIEAILWIQLNFRERSSVTESYVNAVHMQANRILR